MEEKTPATFSNNAAPAAPTLTFGQKAVGLTFNPSGDDAVAKCKQMFADAIDQMHDLRTGNPNAGQCRHASTAITMLEDAQMRAVKALTWRD